MKNVTFQLRWRKLRGTEVDQATKLKSLASRVVLEQLLHTCIPEVSILLLYFNNALKHYQMNNSDSLLGTFCVFIIDPVISTAPMTCTICVVFFVTLSMRHFSCVTPQLNTLLVVASAQPIIAVGRKLK